MTLRFGLIVLLTLVSCSSEQPQQQAAQPEKKGPTAVPIAVANVDVGEAQNRYVTTTTLEAESRADLRSRSTGTVQELLVEEGQSVKAGQVLLVLEDYDQQLRVNAAKIELERVEMEHARLQRMNDAGVLAPQEYETIQIDLKKAKSDLESAELQLSYTRVRAPISGQVVRRLVDLGAHVTSGEMLFVMMDVDPLLARIFIPANRLGGVEVGQSVSMTVDSSTETIQGTISLVSPIVDPETGTVKVTAQLADPGARVRPGDFAEVRVVTDRRENAMLVPSIAVFEEQGKKVLYVAEDNVASRRVVKVGFIDEGYTEILSGIKAAEYVVVKGQRNLRDGVPVDILEGPQDGDQAAVTKVGAAY